MRILLAYLATAALAWCAALSGNKISADGTYTVSTLPGKRYVFAASGDFGSGSLAIQWNDGTTATAFSNSPATAAETWTFTAPSRQVDLVLSGSTAADITVGISLVDGTDALVESADTSTTGGANKIPIFGATGDLTTGAWNNDNVIGSPGGNFWFPDKRGVKWLDRTGADSGAQVYMWEDHDADGGELIVESPHRIALVQGEQGAIQIGLTRATNTVSFTYLQQRYDATSLVPLGESQPLMFNSTWWNGSKVSATGFVGMQGRVRASDGQQELAFFAGSTWPDSHTATDATMPEIVAVTPEGLRDPGNYPAFAGLTDGATVTITCAKTKASQNHYVTLAGSRTLAFSGAEAGMRGTILVSQDSVGSRTLTLPANSATQSGFALSTAAYKVDKIDWVYSGTDYYFTIDKDFILPVDADAQTFLTAASISAASTEGIAINNLVKQLKSDNVWTELLAAYPVVGGNSTAHSKDLKATYNATFGAGVTHDANGITGTAASTSWLNTGINVSALGRKDSIGMYAYSKTSAWTDSGRLFGTSVTNGRLYVSRTGTTLLGHGPCSGTLNTASIASISDYKGHYWWGRASSTSATIRFNSSSQTATDTSNSAPTEPITFLGMNAGSGTVANPTNANLAFCAVTTGDIDATKWSALKAAVDAFETALGRQN